MSERLKNYWEERDRDPGTKITGPECYVFVSYGNRSKGKQLDPITVNKLFNIMGNQLGYGNGKGFIKTRSHALRKYFSSTLENNGFPKNKVDFLLGHTVSDTDKAYFDPDPEKLKQLYKTYLPYRLWDIINRGTGSSNYARHPYNLTLCQYELQREEEERKEALIEAHEIELTKKVPIQEEEFRLSELPKIQAKTK